MKTGSGSGYVLPNALIFSENSWLGFLQVFSNYLPCSSSRIARAYERDWDVRSHCGTNLIVGDVRSPSGSSRKTATSQDPLLRGRSSAIVGMQRDGKSGWSVTRSMGLALEDILEAIDGSGPR